VRVNPCCSASIVTRLRARRLGLDFWQGQGFFPFTTRSDRLYPAWMSIGYRGTLSVGVKRPGLEADHSHPSSADVNTSSYTSSPPVGLHGLLLLLLLLPNRG
jgi:hypothetical protein